MSLFNEKIKNIPLNEVLVLIIILFIIQFIFNSLNIVHINSIWIYLFIIFYFFYKLRDNFTCFKEDFADIFRINLLKHILLIVLLNIFLSYGLLYLSNYLLAVCPEINNLFNLQIFSGNANNSLILIGGFIATVFVSPVCEELIFRGVLINKLKLIVPTTFAILISSLLFASLHPYGSIMSAFVFAICMAVFYIKTENILVAIFAHFLNNLLAEVIVILDKGNILFTNDFIMIVISILAIISGIVLTVALIGELNKIK